MAKNKPIGDGTCLFIDEVGAMRKKVFKVVKVEGDTSTLDFGNGQTLDVKTKNIRAKRLIIWRTKDGKFIVQNPDKWKDIDLKGKDIKELRFNLQNFAIQEGRASIHRWTIPPDRLTKLSALFKLLFICIAIGVIAWSALKFGTYVLDVVMKARLLPCSSVLPTAPVPIGVPLEIPVGVNATG